MSKSLFFVALIAAVVSSCPFLGTMPMDKDITDDAAHCPHGLNNVKGTPDVTVLGCTCSSECGASTDLSGARCDWCYTEDSCGHTGLTGSYDYCVYPASTNYESQTWSQKQDYLWSQVTKDQTSGDYPNVLGILTESVQTSFWNNADVMPAGRKKYIHSVGAVCKFNFMNKNTASGFTGLLEPGVIQHGLIRLGSAAAVTGSSGVIPGLGIKWLRTGKQSANYVALIALGPLPDKSYNFFQGNFSNIIAPPTGALAILAKKFEQASSCASQVGLSDLCMYDIDGNKASNVKFPWKITMQSAVQLPKDSCSQDELQMRIIHALPPNTPLFDISAYTDPAHEASGKPPIHLGTMYTEEACVNSAFGDSSLFFRHQLIEEDWALRPDFLKGTDPQKDCGTSSLSGQPPKPCTDY